MFLFVRYLFANWAFRKLYAEVRAFNLAQFGSGIGRMFEVEGVLTEHAFHDGRYWDQYVLAVSRAGFDGVAAPVRAAVRPRRRRERDVTRLSVLERVALLAVAVFLVVLGVRDRRRRRVVAVAGVGRARAGGGRHRRRRSCWSPPASRPDRTRGRGQGGRDDA